MDHPPLRAHAQSDQGRVHERNEDSVAIVDTEDGRLLIVCDGMGGMGRGDEASQVSLAALTEAMQNHEGGLPPEQLRAAIRAADVRVREELCDPAGQGQPGSTAVMVYVVDGAAHVAWVGDSRAYLIRDGAVIDRTRDHKLVEDLVDAGQLTREEARYSTLAHVVTRALGGRPVSEPVVRAATLGYPWKLMHGDRILVCSDGLSDLVEDDELPPLLAEGDPDAITSALVDLANLRGGHDNITCIVAVWDGPSWVEDEVATPVMAASRMGVADVGGHVGDRAEGPPAVASAVPEDPTKEITEELELDEDPTGSTVPAPEAPLSVLAREFRGWWIAAGVCLAAAVTSALLALVITY